VAGVPGFAAEPAGPEVVAVGVPEPAGPAAELAAEPVGPAAEPAGPAAGSAGPEAGAVGVPRLAAGSAVCVAGVPESLLIFNCRYSILHAQGVTTYQAEWPWPSSDAS
jgi:hypothetical protein